MRRFGIILPLGMALIALAVVPGSTLSQTSKPEEHQHDMEAMAPLKPGPEHAVFKKAAGNWKTRQIMKMDPSHPMESAGEEEVKVICGGLWAEVNYLSHSREMPFEGHGIEGYDPTSKMYRGVWVDSWSTTPTTYEGTADASGKVYTYVMKSVDPMGNPATMCMQVSWTDDNTRVMRMYMGPRAEGDWMMEITYTRM